jgi:hypothetical protein
VTTSLHHQTDFGLGRRLAIRARTRSRQTPRTGLICSPADGVCPSVTGTWSAQKRRERREAPACAIREEQWLRALAATWTAVGGRSWTPTHCLPTAGRCDLMSEFSGSPCVPEARSLAAVASRLGCVSIWPSRHQSAGGCRPLRRLTVPRSKKTSPILRPIIYGASGCVGEQGEGSEVEEHGGQGHRVHSRCPPAREGRCEAQVSISTSFELSGSSGRGVRLHRWQSAPVGSRGARQRSVGQFGEPGSESSGFTWTWTSLALTGYTR